MKSMHLCVFPLKNKIKVILFYKKTDKDYKLILHSINAMSKEKTELCRDILMHHIFHTDFSISDSSKFVRKSVLTYETIIV